MSTALRHAVVAHCNTTKARVTHVSFAHYTAQTPMFMPVGTKGTMKGMTADQLRDLDCQLILANTYHMSLKPGQNVLDDMGGLHPWMGWDRGMLTDSGGFQMVSLLHLSKVNEEGVEFTSPYDSNSRILLTPEMSIDLQNSIGADIIMQLDDVVSPLKDRERIEEAMWRSIRWLDRSIAAHKYPQRQSLFPIIQGGLHADLRKQCMDEMIKRNAPGYAIGGLSGGEDKSEFWKIVSLCTDYLPDNKPRYCMGIGYALDLVVCSALGVDMFDCVYPTRTARFGNALVSSGVLSLKQARYREDHTPIEEGCPCHTCTHYTRSYLHRVVTRETTACHLVTIHNISYQMQLMRQMRSCIIEQRFPEWVHNFLDRLYPNGGVPKWAIDALSSVNIKGLTPMLERKQTKMQEVESNS